MSDVLHVRMEAGSLYAESVADDGEAYGEAPWSPSGERLTLIGARLDATVRWVDVPENLGGGRAMVIGTRTIGCPATGDHATHDVVALDLDRAGLVVCECTVARLFLWWRT